MKLFLLIVFCVLNSLIFFLGSSYYGALLRGSDAQMYYAWPRSVVIDRDVHFENEFKQLTPFPEKIANKEQKKTATGYIENKYPAGYGIVSLPVFAVIHFFVKAITPSFADGYGFVYQAGVGLWHLFLSLIGLIAAIDVVRRVIEKDIILRHANFGIAAIAAGAAWFGSSLFYYASVFPYVPHAAGFAVVSLLVWLLYAVKGRVSFARVGLIGICFSLLVLLRPTNIVFTPLFLAFSGESFSRKQLSIVHIVIGLLGFLVPVLAQLLTWKTIYGSWFVYSYGGEGFYFFSPQWLPVLFSSNHGLFFWSPIWLFAFSGLILGLRIQGTRKISMGALVSFFLLLFVNASWHEWSFGHAFGARAFTEAAFLIVLGVSLFLGSAKNKICFSIVLLCVCWTLYLFLGFTFGEIPSAGELSFDQIFWML